jgi:hypothetical protein
MVTLTYRRKRPFKLTCNKKGSLVLNIKIKPSLLKPGLFKNTDGTFTFVRLDGTSLKLNLYQIQQILEQEREKGDSRIDDNTFSEFVAINA